MSELFKSIGKNDIRNILAVIAVIGCFVLLYLMMIKPIPVENKDIMNIATGFVFGGLLASVAGFYFGASKGQSDVKKGE